MLRLLDALYGDRKGLVEIRAMLEGKVRQEFFAWDAERDELEMFVYSLAKDHDVYFGVLLRERKGGKAIDCEPLIHWLWADIDKKTGATFASILSASVPTPQIVVDSGHGWHLYWHLDQPVTHGLAQDIMASIASQLGGDIVGDPPRIMRMSSTFNRKIDPPVPVRILRMQDLSHGWRVGDFERTRSEDRRTYSGPTGTSGTRSEDLFRLVLDGIAKGLDDEQIYEELLESEPGSKLREMKTEAQRRRWTNLTIKNAKRPI